MEFSSYNNKKGVYCFAVKSVLIYFNLFFDNSSSGTLVLQRRMAMGLKEKTLWRKLALLVLISTAVFVVSTLGILIIWEYWYAKALVAATSATSNDMEWIPGLCIALLGGALLSVIAWLIGGKIMEKFFGYEETP